MRAARAMASGLTVLFATLSVRRATAAVSLRRLDDETQWQGAPDAVARRSIAQ